MNLECKDHYFEQVTSVRSSTPGPVHSCGGNFAELAQGWVLLAGSCAGLSPQQVVYIVIKPIIDLGKPANHQIRNVASPVSSLCQVGKRGFSASTWGLSLSACCCDTKSCEFAARTRARKFAGLMDLLKISSNFDDWNFVPSIFTIKTGVVLSKVPGVAARLSTWVLLGAGATAFIAELGAGRGSLDQQGELQVLSGWVTRLWDEKPKPDLGKRNDLVYRSIPDLYIYI